MPVHLYAYRYRYINKAYKQTLAIGIVTKNLTYSIYIMSIQSAQKNLADFHGREKSCGRVNTQPIKMIFSGSLNEGQTEPSKKNQVAITTGTEVINSNRDRRKSLSPQEEKSAIGTAREKSSGRVNTQPIKMIFSGSLNEGQTEPSKKNQVAITTGTEVIHMFQPAQFFAPTNWRNSKNWMGLNTP